MEYLFLHQRGTPCQHRCPAAPFRGRRPGRALVLLIALLVSRLVFAHEAGKDWYLVEFADSRPPCIQASTEARCLGTRPTIARFEIRDGERIEMPDTGEIPPAWARFDQMWVYAPAAIAGSGNRFIELVATPSGARLSINDRGRQYLQSVPLGEWVALESDPHPKLWVRVTAE